MKAYLKFALTVAALALVVPAFALADPGNGQGQGQGQGQGTGPDYAPAPPPQAKAYGFYCQGASKKHVAGTPGTPFSECVANMKQAANNPGLTPRQVCKNESKKHVKGKKGTPFSLCVKAAAKLRHDERKAAE